MHNLLNYKSVVVSVKYTTKYLLSSVKALVLVNECTLFSEKSELQIENLLTVNL